MKLTKVRQAILATFLAQSIWGIAGPIIKIALNTAPPISFLFLRLLTVSFIMFFIYEIRFAKKYANLSFSDKKYLFLAGFTGVFANTLFYFFGQKLTTVIDTWVIASTGTVFVVIYSFIFLKERLPKLTYLGISLAFLGGLIIIGSPLLSIGNGNLLGNIFILSATIAGASSYLMIKKLIDHVHPLVICYYSFFYSTLLLTPFFIWDFTQNPLWLGQINSIEIATLIFLVLGSSIVAYTTSNWGLKYLSASLAATIGYFSPIIAIGLSIIFLGEKPSFYFIFGAIFVISGLLLAESRHKHIGSRKKIQDSR